VAPAGDYSQITYPLIATTTSCRATQYYINVSCVSYFVYYNIIMSPFNLLVPIFVSMNYYSITHKDLHVMWLEDIICVQGRWASIQYKREYFFRVLSYLQFPGRVTKCQVSINFNNIFFILRLLYSDKLHIV